MLSRNKFMAVAGGVFAGLFLVGLVQLLQLRFSAGDVYPPYSSLRADPLGTRALYESLDALPGMRVERYYQEFFKASAASDATFLVLGLPADTELSLPLEEARELERFVGRGGRAVFTFRSVNDRPLSKRLDELEEQRQKAKAKEKSSPAKKSRPAQKEETADKQKELPTDPFGNPGQERRKRRHLDDEREEAPFRTADLCERWKFQFAYQKLPRDDQGGFQTVEVERTATNASLPARFDLHSAMYFEKLEPGWRTIYERDGKPVVIEQSMGRGTVALVADSYFASNEALREDRQPGLLAWLVGDSSRVIFDEAHLGVAENPGLAALVRKYRLHGVVAGFVVIALLFVWKNALSFVTPYEEIMARQSDGAIIGRDTSAGFVNLLRRSIGGREVLKVCFREWKRSCVHGRADLAKRAGKMETVMQDEMARPAREQNPVGAYRTMSRILAEKS